MVQTKHVSGNHLHSIGYITHEVGSNEGMQTVHERAHGVIPTFFQAESSKKQYDEQQEGIAWEMQLPHKVHTAPVR